jgi:hypothetical protein
MLLARIAAASVLVLSSQVQAEERCTPAPSERPVWVTESPRGYAFDYFAGQGEDAASPVRARALAVGNAVATIVARGLISVQMTQSTKQSEEQGKFLSSVTEEITISGHSTQVQGLEQVELHLEQCANSHRAFALVRIPKKVPETPPSAMEPVWRSAVAPGWGQFYKGHTTRGSLILVGEGLLIPTALITYLMSSNAASDARASTTQANRDFFQDRSDRLYGASLLAGGAAVALYLYNVIDAAASAPRNVYADAGVVPLPGGAQAFASVRF